MKRLRVPYGKESFTVEVDERHILDLVEPRKIDVSNGRAILAKSIEQPLGRQSLKDFLKNTKRVNFVVNDGTRPTRTAWVIDLIADTINIKDVQFIIATGAHPRPSERQLHRIFGEHYDNCKERITIHDARDDGIHEYVGKTRYGNELWLDKLVTRNDKTVVVGSVEPHYFAGFTGGRKSFLPGIAAYRTIGQNHRLALNPGAQSLNLDGNPVHEEMIDCIDTFGKDRIYAVQMILDTNHTVCRAFTGPIDLTFNTAVEEARDIFSAKISQKADVVVTVSRPPFDVDFYQTLKAIEHGRLAMKPGGILIVVSPCQEGLGPVNFARLFENNNAITTAAHKARTDYELGDHNAHNLIRLHEQGKVWAVTRIAGSVLKTAKVGSHRSLQAAIDRAIKEKGHNTKILFLLNGSLTVPTFV
jgi:nickel-dependent lactate racemase